MNRTAIKCNCGHRIGQREVMQTGYYPRMFGPSLICIKFRCSRCKKVDEQFVKQEDWENGILGDAGLEASAPEKERFTELGPIEMQELADFHNELENLSDLSGLIGEFRDTNDSKRDDETK